MSLFLSYFGVQFDLLSQVILVSIFIFNLESFGALATFILEYFGVHIHSES